MHFSVFIWHHNCFLGELRIGRGGSTEPFSIESVKAKSYSPLFDRQISLPLAHCLLRSLKLRWAGGWLSEKIIYVMEKLYHFS